MPADGGDSWTMTICYSAWRWAFYLGCSPSRPRRSPSVPDDPDDRQGPGATIHPSRGSLLAALDQLVAVDRILDLIGILFILALLSYGAWVAPRVRYVLGSAVLTVVACWMAWRTISRWLP